MELTGLSQLQHGTGRKAPQMLGKMDNGQKMNGQTLYDCINYIDSNSFPSTSHIVIFKCIINVERLFI